MTPKTVLFVGLGGAGQRHLRILRARLPDARFMALRRRGVTPLLNPDFSVSEGRTLEEVYGIERMNTLEAGLAQRPDLVVISTPSSLHLESMMAAARYGAGILVEKPWSHTLAGFDAFRRAVEDGGGAFRISFQRRFHPFVARVRELVTGGALGRIVSATFIVGSYVPSWHPYEDWHGLYAVRPELGGGVLLTEIHEIDLAHWFFGVPERVFCVGGNFGPEPLAVEDTAQLTLDYGAFSVQLSLCFMQKKPRRGLEIAGTLGHLSWDADGNRTIHTHYASGRREETADPAFVNDSMFEAQADAMLGNLSPLGSEEALKAAWVSQAVVAAAKRSMSEKRAVAIPALFSEVLQ